MVHFHNNNNTMTSNRKLQFLLETKLSSDDKVPKTGRLLRNKIFVIGFPPNCTEMDLEAFFSNFGLVRETRIVRDEKGVTKGFAFITFTKERSVVHALEYRGPLYFMDRKLSINPAIKKQHPFVETDRRCSSSTSIDTPSDSSTTTNNANDPYASTNLPRASVPIMSQANAAPAHAYYNTPCQPYFQFNVPSHPLYCASVSNPVWHPYFPSINPYQSCPYIPLANNGDPFSVPSELHGVVYHNSSMIRYRDTSLNNKILS